MIAPARRTTGPQGYRTKESFDVRIAARVLADAFRRGSRAAREDQTDPQVANLTRKVQKGTLKLLEHLVIFARNWFLRGADQESVEALGHAYVSVVRSWYGEDTGKLSLADLARADTVAQSIADPEQWDLTGANVSYKDICEAEAALSVHLTTLSRLVWRLREEKYRSIPAVEPKDIN